MKIQLKRVYEINFDGTAAEFIALVDRELRLTADNRLDSLDMGDAVGEATALYDQGDMTDLVDVIDNEYNYIDCPDKDTQLAHNSEQDKYFVTDNVNVKFCTDLNCPCNGQFHPEWLIGASPSGRRRG